MELHALIQALSTPDAFPGPPPSVEVRQTHISVVFLAGEFVYKVKKPVALGFLDFSTLDKRRHYCEEEVRLNQRLAAGVYLGVVPVARTPGGIRVEQGGEVVDWAVKMRRLPDESTLLHLLESGAVEASLIEALARRVALFHQQARSDERIAAFGRFTVVARVIGDLIAQVGSQCGVTVHPDVLARVAARADQALCRLRGLIDSRAARGLVRECHGDLRLDHVFVFPGRPPPGDLVMIDCIEFSERLRCIDTVADAAFLAMDLALHGRRDLATAFTRRYLQAADDEREGGQLLPLFLAYRSAVRGVVRGMQACDLEVEPATRAAALEKAQAHWLLALTELEPAGRRPCLLLVGGLPGTGKSTLAQALAERAGFEVIRSDVVRKCLAGLGPTTPGSRESLYTPAWDDRTYAECQRRAERMLFEGKRVLVDATWREERRRASFLATAQRWGVPGGMLLCRASPNVARGRLANRVGDASDAGWSVYEELANRWEEIGDSTRTHLHILPADGSPHEVTGYALQALRQMGLLE